MGTLEQTRDTRRLRWPLSLTRAPQKNGESESQGCLSTTSRSRTPAATLSSLSRCWSRAGEVVSRWLCLLQSPGGMITGSAPHPAGEKQAGISHQRGGGKQQKIEMTYFYPIAKKQ